jgi:hypothetical protein
LRLLLSLALKEGQQASKLTVVEKVLAQAVAPFGWIETRAKVQIAEKYINTWFGF